MPWPRWRGRSRVGSIWHTWRLRCREALALAGLGTWSAWRMRELGAVAERFLADNYLSVDAAHRMRSLERLEATRRAAAAGTAGEPMAGPPSGEIEHPAFERAFRSAAGNITESGETEVIAAISDGYTRYQRTPTSVGVESVAMQNQNDAAGALARRDVLWAIGLLGVLTLGGAWLTWAVARSVIGPIEALTRRRTDCGGGPRRDHSGGPPDELGQMARAFNEMARRSGTRGSRTGMRWPKRARWPSGSCNWKTSGTCTRSTG